MGEEMDWLRMMMSQRMPWCRSERISQESVGVSHGTQGKAKQRKEKERQAKQTKAKQKRSKSNCDATTVTCYPRAGVSHVTLGGQVYHFGGERDVELEGEDGSQGSEVLQHS